MSINIKLDKFEGPLGLLLELIETQKLEISEISLAQVTDQYLAYIEESGAVESEALADFLVVASRLLLIKSRTLLPSLQLSVEEEAEIRDLEHALKEYRRYKQASRHIQALTEANKFILTKELWQGLAGGFFPPQNVSPTILASALLQTLNALAKFLQPLDQAVVKRVTSIETKIKEILKRIEKKAKASLKELAGSGQKLDLILAFLAILFLFREKLIHLHQGHTFGEIIVGVRKEPK